MLNIIFAIIIGFLGAWIGFIFLKSSQMHLEQSKDIDKKAKTLLK